MREKLSYSEAGRLGATKSNEVQKRKKTKRIEQYNNNPNICKCCNKKLSYSKRRNKFCSHSCAAQINNLGIRRHGHPKSNHCLFCEASLVGKRGRKYCSTKCQHGFQWEQTKKDIESGSTDFTANVIKKYLLEMRGHGCEICKNKEWQGQQISIEIDHVNGNSEDNDLDNVRLICPNCHALTATYKARNTGNGRAKRRARYKEGKSY